MKKSNKDYKALLLDYNFYKTVCPKTNHLVIQHRRSAVNNHYDRDKVFFLTALNLHLLVPASTPLFAPSQKMTS